MPAPTRTHSTVARKTVGNDDKVREMPANIDSDDEFGEVSITLIGRNQILCQLLPGPML